ncbi:zinc finger CCCH domain-containing protein 19-like isoform X1 [Hordeum vulgare subsp. vulgare]|uniref:zinc finger CCCH domain-containing protein 19-like isoform X1 n=1 Tax=Hordeum vulgare subsp. vulgare TaxID=112509 RepID=UPI0002957CD7|nr:zinc finger CCCH domain-containing protein 19-like isoform X1 [Hordeum vulgare subsp. vulgare]
MPTTPDIVLEGDGGGGGEKPEEDALAAGDDVAAGETVGVENDCDLADEEGAAAGLQSNEEDAAAVDDPADLGADVGSDQTGQGIHDGADEADQFGLGVQGDAPLIVDSDIAVSDYGVDAHDEEGAPMDAVAATELIDREAELVKDDDDVAEVDTHPSAENDDEEEAVAAAGDALTDEGRQMDAASISTDVDEEKAAGVVGVNATGEDIQVDTVHLAIVDNQENEISSAVGDDAGEKGMESHAVIMAGGEGEKDAMAAQNVAEKADRVPVEAELNMIDNVVVEEVTEMDILASTGNGNEDEGVVTVGDASADEGTLMDAVSISRDVNEENCTNAAGVGATDEDMQVDGGDNQEKEACDDGADEEGVEKHAVTMAGEDEEDDMAEQNIAEEADSVPEEAEADMAGDVPEEEDVQIYEDDDDDEPPPLARRGVGRPKRGRASSKAQAVVKPSVKRKDEEEVCFICFDGGELVICDRRYCPKAYHPSCINRDDDFFKSKGQWTCGWHICSNCQKPARQMCYTCTFSLCKTCIKETNFISVRGTKGFCETCMNTVMLIENKEEATEQMDVDFDDKDSWWSLFKDYWLNLKEKLPLPYEEISAARHLNNRSYLSELPEANDEEEANSDSSPKTRGKKRLKRAADEDSSKGKGTTRKYTKQGSVSRDAKPKKPRGAKTRQLSKRASSSDHGPKESESVGTSTSSAEEANWASNELLDFVAHMRNGDKSVLSQFEAQRLVLDYIARENLRDPRGKSMIVCDSWLQSLSGKERVGHFELLKLLESHFPLAEVSPADIDGNHGGVVDPDPSQDADGNSEASVVMSSEKRRKSRKYDQRALQTNLDDFAAIDNHNIGLIYLRRNLMEELIGDADTFSEKVLGAFVRIRISGTGQRQDIYRLVQIVGTGTAAEKYKCGKKTTDITLEILNLDKKEVITIDITSNQEFTEEECKRLRQSIKCGFISRLTVGEIQEKARVLQSVKVNDWIESEKMRLAHLRDRASDMGHRKELRECVEKLKLLSTPEERARRLKEEPEIHADPAMDPNYESPEEPEEDAERSSFSRPRGSFSRKDINPVSPGKGEGRNAARDSRTNWESNRNTWSSTQLESPHGRRSTFSSHGESAGYTGKSESPNVSAQKVNVEATAAKTPHGPSVISSQTLTANLMSPTPASQSTVNESEKIWQYMDPSNKIQGPFSIVQLRKWNSSGYFPHNLKIWKSNEKQEDSILLPDALAGKFEKDLPPWEPPLGSSSQTDKGYLRSSSDVGARPSGDSLVERTKAGEHISKSAVLNKSQSFPDTTNPGSTMIQSGAQSYYGTQNPQAAFASQQSLIESWNASSSQFGAAVNPMTLPQPTIGGGFSGQNSTVAGNVGQLTPVPAPATVGTEIGEDRGLAQPGAVPSNTPRFEDARNQSTDASNSTQLMTHAQVANTSGQAQGAGNTNWGSALQSNANMAWGMMGQTNMNMPWAAPAQGAASYNMGMTMPTQQNAVQNMGWVAPNPGNTNMNMVWATNQGQGTPNAAAMMGAQMQGVTTAPWGGAIAQGNANSYPGWAPQVGNASQNVGGWSAPAQGNPGPNPVNGTGQGNNNVNWNSPSENPTWNNQQDFNGGGSSGRSWRPQSGGRGPRPPTSYGRGFCYQFQSRGYCSREHCPWSHTHGDEGYSQKNDRHFERPQHDRRPLSNERPQHDRRPSSNERPQHDRRPSSNERPQHDRQNDKHFDCQASGSEGQQDRPDNRQGSWDNGEKTDKSESKERQ